MVWTGFLIVKKTFNGAQTVMKSLGKYTHRIAVSNHRIVRMDDDTVTFLVKDHRHEGQWKELTIPGVEFVRRFLMHVPPRRFVRIRHYGLLCSRTKKPEAHDDNFKFIGNRKFEFYALLTTIVCVKIF